MLKRNETANFDILSYFEGRTFADGVFEDRFGKLKRRFTVDMMGTAEGNTLTLAEAFAFDDGVNETRTWVLQRGEGQTFTGTCGDAVSTAHGHFASGQAFLTSELRLAVGSRRISMRFEDVFYQTGNGTVLNRSTVSKWGVRLGQVLIIFRKA